MRTEQYCDIAKIISDSTTGQFDTAGHLLICKYALLNDLCFYFKKENPRFNEQKFRDACNKE